MFYRLVGLILIIISIIAIRPYVFAQDDPSSTIELIGAIESIAGLRIVVDGTQVDISNLELMQLEVGMRVKVTGILQDGVVLASAVEILVSPPVVDTDDPIIVIEGPVINITNNIITIYDFDIEVDPTNPILSLIDTNTFLRVVATAPLNAPITALSVSNITVATSVTTTATVSLDGPIESINNNLIVVNSIPIQLDPNAPILQTLKVGDFLSVEGDFRLINNTYILVVVNIVIINNIIIDNNPACWFHNDGMGMGHWHCDGYAMGMGYSSCYFGTDSMGMGEARWFCDDGMGMGMAMGLGPNTVCQQTVDGYWYCIDAMGMGR